MIRRRVLVLYYSQTGQLERLLRSVLAPFEASADVQVAWCRLEPVTPYPFPWPMARFFAQFPECVSLDPAPIRVTQLGDHPGPDLIVLGCQPWFLSPVPPVTAFLQSGEGRAWLRGRPVVTVIGARNLWLTMMQTLRRLILDAGGKPVGTIAVVDPSPAACTFLTTPLWMFTGDRRRLRALPPAGLSDADIAAARAHGDRLLRGLLDGRLASGERVLDAARAAPVEARHVAAERIGARSFRIWGAAVRRAGPPGSWRRMPVLALYVVFLIAAILTILPLTALARGLLRGWPPHRRRMAAEIARLQAL